MLSIYKKVEKTIDNPSGFIKLTGIDEMTKPFLLCLSAEITDDKFDIYRMIKVGTQLARVYSQEDAGARFKIEEFPVDIIGIQYQKDTSFRERYEEITDDILYPLLANKASYRDLLKAMRRINVLTFGEGVDVYKKIETRLISKLKLDGYTDKQLSDAFSLIGIVSLNTKYDTSTLKSKSIEFNDILDLKTISANTSSYLEQLRTKKTLYGPYEGTKNTLCIYKGTGFHKADECLKRTCVVKPAMCAIVSYLLEKSIENEMTNQIVPIYTKDIIKRIVKYTEENKRISSLLDELDKELVYGNAPKYTIEEERKKCQEGFDISYQILNNLKDSIMNLNISTPDEIKQKKKDDDKK